MRYLLFFLLFAFSFGAETLHYRVRNGETVVRSRWFIQKEKAELYRESETQTYHFNASGKTVEYALYDTAVGSNYTVRRQGNKLIMSGIVRGKSVDKTVKIDGAPWQQSVHDLSGFALMPGNAKSHTFWVVRPVDLKVVKMKATLVKKKSDAENVTVKIVPVGVLSLLWKAYYTYRKSDGRFVEYRSVHGPPGTPETVVSLI